MKKIVAFTLISVFFFFISSASAFAHGHHRYNRNNNYEICDYCGTQHNFSCGHGRNYVDNNGDGVCDNLGIYDACNGKGHCCR